MNRRAIISLIGGAAASSLSWPLAARAQQSAKVARIGFFGPGLTASATIAPYQAFLAQLRELGFCGVKEREAGPERRGLIECMERQHGPVSVVAAVVEHEVFHEEQLTFITVFQAETDAGGVGDVDPRDAEHRSVAAPVLQIFVRATPSVEQHQGDRRRRSVHSSCRDLSETTPRLAMTT